MMFILIIDNYLFNENNDYLRFEEKIQRRYFFKQRNFKSRHIVLKDNNQFELNVRKIGNDFFEYDYKYLISVRFPLTKITLQ